MLHNLKIKKYTIFFQYLCDDNLNYVNASLISLFCYFTTIEFS